MRANVRVLCAAAVLAVPAAPLIAPSFAADAPATVSPAWTVPVALDSGGAEPSIRVPSDGRSAAYISAPSGLGSNFWRIDESVDANGVTTLKPSAGVQPDMGTGGGDAEISVGTSVDPATGCAPIAYSGLHNIDLLDNFTVAQSLDCGRTFSLLNPYGTQNTLTDRQWQAFDGIKTNHLLYHKVDTGQIVDSRSEDGGQTYVTLGTPAGATGVIDAQHAYTIQNVKIGNVVTDLTRPVVGQTYPISGEQVHTLWATFAGSRDPADAVAGSTGSGGWDHLDTIYVARSDDGGLTWTDTQSFTTQPSEKRELDLIFPVISVDKAGNLYSAWTDGNLIQYVASTDGGATWSKPYTVNPGEAGAQPTGGTADLFPWIAAGGDGRLDVVWYHGEGGDTTGYRNVGDADTKWTVAFAQLADATATDGAGVASPTVVDRDLAVTPVMHTGNVCNNGTTCGITDDGDRTLLDFFQVAIDAQGRANIAYAADQGSAGTAHVEYVRQNSGQSLYDGSAITPNLFVATGGPTCAPTGVITDPAGDATGAVLVDSTPTPSQDDLDVVRAYLTTGGTAADPTITTHVKVTDLGSSGGQYFRYYFSYGTGEYLTIASRSVAGATSYSLSQNGTTGASSLKSISGAFDEAADEVTATFRIADFNSTAHPAQPMAIGSSLGGMQVLGQRNTGAITATSDTATGTCPYIVGATAADPNASASATPTATVTPTASTSASPSASASASASATPTVSVTPTASPAAGSPSASPTSSSSPEPVTVFGSSSPSASPTDQASSSPASSPSSPAASASSSASSSSQPSSGGTPMTPTCPTSPARVTINTRTINATGLASVTVNGARPGAVVELQGYSQNHYGTASFGNDGTPVDRRAKADANGAVTFKDLRPASNTRLRARQQGCTFGSSAVIEVRAQETLQVARNGVRTYTFSGRSIPARPGGLIVSLYRVVGRACAAGVEPSGCPGEVFVAQARAQALGAPNAGLYSITVTFPKTDADVRDEFVVKTGRDAQNAPGRSNVRSLAIF